MHGFHKPTNIYSYVAMCEIHGMHHPGIHSSYATEQLLHYTFVNNNYNYEWRMKISCILEILDQEKSTEMNHLNRELLGYK